MVDVRLNGRISDGGVLGHSDFGKMMENQSLNIADPQQVRRSNKILPYVFVADDAFAMNQNLLKPYSRVGNNLTEEQRILNYRLSRARRIVENAFGVLVSRCSILQKDILLSPDKAQTIVLACCHIHKYLRSKNSKTYIGQGSVDFDNHEIGQMYNGGQAGPSTGYTSTLLRSLIGDGCDISDVVSQAQEEVLSAVAGRKGIDKGKTKKVNQVFSVAKDRLKKILGRNIPTTANMGRGLDPNGETQDDGRGPEGIPGWAGEPGGGKDPAAGAALMGNLFRGLRWIAVGVDTSHNNGTLTATGVGADLVANAVEDTAPKSQLLNPARAQFKYGLFTNAPQVAAALGAEVATGKNDWRQLGLKVALNDELREQRVIQPTGVEWAWALREDPARIDYALNNIGRWHYDAIIISVDVLEWGL